MFKNIILNYVYNEHSLKLKKIENKTYIIHVI